jgi:DNA-binding transcriptional ArsR family regulator
MAPVASAPEQPPDHVAMAKALSHPLRFRLLQHYCQEVTSPSRLARTLGARLGDATYHTRVLRDLGCIELVRTEPRRGAREHFYRGRVVAILDDAVAATMPADSRRAILSGILGDIWSDLNAAAAAGVLDRPDVHISRTALELDEQGFHELSERLESLLRSALEIQAESKSRIADGAPRATRPTELALLHFTRSPGEPAEPR